MSERFENYEVLRRDDGSLFELGRGGMGVTYKAFDTDLHTDVALKVIHPDRVTAAGSHERFVREARSAARLRHPNIATVYRLGKTSDGSMFYAMEFCTGPTLAQAVAERGPFPAVEALQVCLQVCKALVIAEQYQLLHRDLKPANLILSQRPDEGLVVKVIDFGLAKCIDESQPTEISLTMGGFVGTAHFASPEQLEGDDLDVRSDLFSLGGCLWFALTGGPMFRGSLAQIMTQTLTSEPPWQKLQGQPEAVIALARRLLARQREGRPATAAAARQEIERTLRSLNAAVPDSAQLARPTVPDDPAISAAPTYLPPAPPPPPLPGTHPGGPPPLSSPGTSAGFAPPSRTGPPPPPSAAPPPFRPGTTPGPVPFHPPSAVPPSSVPPSAGSPLPASTAGFQPPSHAGAPSTAGLAFSSTVFPAAAAPPAEAPKSRWLLWVLLIGVFGMIGLALVAGVGFYLYTESQKNAPPQHETPDRTVDNETPEPPAPTPPPEPPAPAPPPAPAEDYTIALQPGDTWPITASPISYAQQIQLVGTTLTAFDRGLRAGTLRYWHDTFIANAVKPKYSAASFDQNFQRFIQNQIYLYPETFRASPTFTKAENANADASQIQFAGDYVASTPSGRLQVKWELLFMYEPSRGWRVVWISINTNPLK